MKRYNKLIILNLIALFLAFANTANADSAPAWVTQAASASIPAYDKDVPAVMLLDNQEVTLENEGKLVTREYHVIKILTRDGRRLASAEALYLVNSSKIRTIQAWHIRNGVVKEYEKKNIVDIISDADDVYDEYRVKIINGSDDADENSIFAYYVETEDSPLFYQDIWRFQNRLPVIESRYTLALPNGWTANSTTFNSDEIKPSINGSTYSWQMRNLAPIPHEPLSPSSSNLSPRIAVTFTPPNGATNKTFSNWTQVAQWGAGMHEGYVIVDDAVAAKARELTANATTEFEKIRAIGSFVQNIQYISIDIGVGHGNGYRPRSSATVLARGYGDCKDKANLMRAMLRVLKIDAVPVAIFSGDPTFVRENWASPSQFNHCIIAVKVSPETKTPTVIEDAKLGRLMMFDATDPYTPVGDLPDYLQGSYALLMAAEGGLAKMPLVPASSDVLDRTISAELSPTGDLKGKITEKTTGQNSAWERRAVRELTPSDYKRMIEGWLTRGATGTQLVSLNHADDPQNASFKLDVEFSASRYAQIMQRLLVFKPAIVGRKRDVVFSEKKRVTPVELDTNSMREKVVITIPAGYIVDELPEPVTVTTSFGKYTTSYEVVEGKLIFSRMFTTERVIIPAERFNEVRDFFAKIVAGDQAPVVLAKK